MARFPDTLLEQSHRVIRIMIMHILMKDVIAVVILDISNQIADSETILAIIVVELVI